LEGLLQDEPNDIETICYLAHIYKEMWRDEWVRNNEQDRLKGAYESVHLLKKAIETYLKAYCLNHNHCYSGINALTLSTVLDHLVEQVGTDSDPEEEAIRQQLPALKGAVQFSLESAAKRDSNDFWAFVSLADVAVCTANDPKQVRQRLHPIQTISHRKFSSFPVT
jgi:hypothetical protein